jgi:hypothetical protein
MFERLYKLFGKVTKEGFRGFMLKRFPLYVLGILILIFGGVKGLAMTLLCLLCLFLGWTAKGAVAAYKDYRLTQRLDRIHFTAIEFDAMKRERDLAITAFQEVTAKAVARVKAAGMPPTPAMPRQRATFGEDEIQEYIRQHGGLEGER